MSKCLATKTQVPDWATCVLCQDDRIDEYCSICPARLKVFREDPKNDCCKEKCIKEKINKEGNLFATMNYVYRIRRDLVMQIDPDKKANHLVNILMSKS